MKYRKKPIVIEAVKYKNNNDEPIDFNEKPKWLIEAIFDTKKLIFCLNEKTKNIDLKVKTLEGEMKISNGDYVIKGVNGELYPCKPDIFEKTYEKVDDGELKKICSKGDK